MRDHRQLALALAAAAAVGADVSYAAGVWSGQTRHAPALPAAIADALHAATAARVVHFWRVPGSKGTCIVWETATGPRDYHSACAGLAQMSSTGLVETLEERGGRELVFGVAPDSVTSVEVTNADGQRIFAPVANHVYALTDFTGNARSIAMVYATGTSRTRPLQLN